MLMSIGWLTRFTWLSGMYTYLDTSTTPQEADAIVVLAGGDGARLTTGLTLYLSRYAPRIVVSTGSYDVGANIAQVRVMQHFDVPPEAVVYVGNVDSTWTEAHEVFEALTAMGARSAIIVTDGFHTRRASAVYDKLNDEGLQLRFVAATDPFTHSNNWWQYGWSRRMIISEYVKMIYYLFAYGVFSW